MNITPTLRFKNKIVTVFSIEWYRVSEAIVAQVRLYILFYKRSNHEESFRAEKINRKSLIK